MPDLDVRTASTACSETIGLGAGRLESRLGAGVLRFGTPSEAFWTHDRRCSGVVNSQTERAFSWSVQGHDPPPRSDSAVQPAHVAAKPYVRALRIELIPQIETTKDVGLVVLPGAMTGPILAGDSPIYAVLVQAAVMYLYLDRSPQPPRSLCSEYNNNLQL